VSDRSGRPLEESPAAEAPPVGRMLRKSDAVATRTVAQETLLVPFRGTLASLRQIFALNSVAAFVWARMDGAVAFETLVSAVCDRFDVDGERARVDLEELIADMQAAGLVSEAGCEAGDVESD